MKAATQRQIGRPALDVIEDAIHLLREAPVELHLTYLVGSVPFVLALLWFWADMTRGAFADARCASAALGLAVLYLWMKSWQSVYAAGLTNRLRLREKARLTPGRWMRIMSTQAAIQSWSLIVIPLSCALLLVPLPFAFGFFQSATVTADAAQGSASICLRNAWREGWRWSGQNFAIFHLLVPIAFGVGLNMAIALGFTPYLVHLLSGMASDFNLSSATIFNTTFLAAVAALTYLVVDPMVKAAYVIRCFEGEAVSTGDDLRTELKRLRSGRALALAVVLILTGGIGLGLPHVQAEARVEVDAPETATAVRPPPTTPSVRPQELDRALRTVLERADYTWRAKRVASPEESESAKAGTFLHWWRLQMKAVGDFVSQQVGNCFSFIDRILRSIFGKLPGMNLPTGSAAVDWLTAVKIVVVLLLAAGAGWLAWLGRRLWLERKPRQPKAASLPAQPEAPDLNQETVSADQLPEDQWLALARDLAGRGEMRLAFRAVYLANLAHLARREIIRLSSFKTNRDYQREVVRRTRSLPALAPQFDVTAVDFDRVWYGNHPVSTDLLNEAAVRLHNIQSTTFGPDTPDVMPGAMPGATPDAGWGTRPTRA